MQVFSWGDRRQRLALAGLLFIVSLQLVPLASYAQNLGQQPATGQAVQGQTAAQPEGAVLNLVIWVGNVIAPVAGQFQGQFVQMRQIFQVPTASATLATPKQLEQSPLSRNPGAVPQITNNYSALYGTVMPSTDAPQQVRDLVDMTDAEAQAAMKKTVEIDALADLELQAAEQINQQLQTAAPGSASILQAQTSAWLVRANAYTQSAMAELVRVRSIELANSGAQVKFSAAHTSTLHNAGNLLLQGAH